MAKRRFSRVTGFDEGIVCALDPGSASIIALIVDLNHDVAGAPAILGMGVAASKGLRDGALVDAQTFSASVRQAASRAADAAGAAPRETVMSYSSPHMMVRALRGEHEPAAVRKALIEAGLAGLHVQPLERCGETLIRILAAPREDVAAMRDAVCAAGLEPLKIAAGVYAAARGALADRDWSGEHLVIDMGASQTSLAHLRAGGLENAAVIPIGGRHVTGDLAQGLDITVESAERLKMSAPLGPPPSLEDPEDNAPRHAVLGGASVGERLVSTSEVRAVMEPRLTETLEMIAAAAARWDVAQAAPAVLSGGAAGVQGLEALATRVLGRRAVLAGEGAEPGERRKTVVLAVARGLAMLAAEARRAQISS